MNEVMQTILTRRSIRAFTDQNIEKDVLRQLADAARYAPSAMNRQTWKFTVVSNAKYIHALASAISAHLNRGGDYNFYGATALILASNEKDNPHGTEDCACALENIFLASSKVSATSRTSERCSTSCICRKITWFWAWPLLDIQPSRLLFPAKETMWWNTLNEPK